jgi:glycosyltransferase involved in cell wall biosynthesis
VDLEQYSSLPEPASARSQLGLPDKFTIGYTGHLYPGRGMKLLVGLARRFPQLSFLWVGGRPEDVRLWQVELTAEKLANITLTGFVHNSQVPLYQAACEVLLMPYETVITGSSGGDSTSYASPMKMFEYMAAGRAILSSDLPVLHEVLDGRMAIFCPLEASGAWETALGQLLGDEALRKSLGQHARAAVEQYSWARRAQRVLEGFHEISA